MRTWLGVMIGGCLGLTGVLAPAVRSQGVLVGCRLGATLQCVPGLTMTPEQQIKVLEGRIASEQQAEGTIADTIQGLKRFELSGRAAIGAVLNANLSFDPDDFSAVQVHWYRRMPESSLWQLVGQVDERTYRISSDDLGSSVMAIVAMQRNGAVVVRHHSNVIGPITE